MALQYIFFNKLVQLIFSYLRFCDINKVMVINSKRGLKCTCSL